MFTGCYRCGSDDHVKAQCPHPPGKVVRLVPPAHASGAPDQESYPAAPVLSGIGTGTEPPAAYRLARAALGGRGPVPRFVGETWTVRGQRRTRSTFGLPHIEDFGGGLPIPPEYPFP